MPENMNENNGAAIIVAAGRGSRMQSDTPKQYLMLGEHPVLWYSLRIFQDFSPVRRMILVVSEEDSERCRREFGGENGFSKLEAVVPGGSERYLSVREGLRAAAGADWVMIHDGARPLIDMHTLKRSLACVLSCGACAAAVPVKDTIKEAGEDGVVISTPDRSRLFSVQTPQTFSYPLIAEAYRRLDEAAQSGRLPEHITDDAMVVEMMMNHPVRLCLGDYRNLKITTPEDMMIAEALRAAL